MSQFEVARQAIRNRRIPRRFIEVSVGSTTYNQDDPTVQREYIQKLIENWGAVKGRAAGGTPGC